ncbi:MAG: hypothetical protein NTV43_08230 [Methylococcales bacterium]|nr:hypothetical protein [Methylococcales bacterium]
MTLSTSQKIIYSLVLLGIAILVTIPDVVFSFLFELFHLFFELLFILFEWLESSLDTVIEHLLETELHQTQTIVFYLIVLIIAYPAYYLYKKLKQLYLRLKRNFQTAQSSLNNLKSDVKFFWHDMTLIDRMKGLVITIGLLYLASFLFM